MCRLVSAVFAAVRAVWMSRRGPFSADSARHLALDFAHSSIDSPLSIFGSPLSIFGARSSAFVSARLRNVAAMSALALLLWLLPAGASADSPLHRPLTFLPAGAILVVDPSPANAVQRILRVSPYLAPQADTLTAHSARAFRRLAARRPDLSRCTPDTLARLFLVTGDARVAAALDSVRLRRDSLLSAAPSDRAAAQALLNSLGWVAAAEGTDLYVNLPVDCMINVSTPALHCTVDQIYETGRVKYRLAGFPADGSRLRLHLRLPAGVVADDVFLNGRRLLAPRMERGYLVVDRAWRNNEEIYYDLPERATLLGD